MQQKGVHHINPCGISPKAQREDWPACSGVCWTQLWVLRDSVDASPLAPRCHQP